MTDDELDGYLTTQEAAAYLGTSRSNFEKLLYRSRQLQPDKNLYGRRLLFKKETLDAFKRVWRRRAPARQVDK